MTVPQGGLFFAAVIQVAFIIGKSAAIEAEGEIRREWLATLRERVDAEIKNLEISGIPIEDEPALYEATLEIAQAVFHLLEENAEDK